MKASTIILIISNIPRIQLRMSHAQKYNYLNSIISIFVVFIIKNVKTERF